MNNNIEKSISDINNAQKKFEETVNNNKTEDGETNSIGLVLFNQISESTINILKTSEIEKSLLTISKNMNIDEESLTSLINIIAISMTNSSYQAILFYDDLLKKELTKQMDNISHHMNLCKSDIEAHKSVLQVFKKQMGEINNTLQINNFKKNIEEK